MLPSATIFILPQEINASLGIFLKEWCTIGHFQDTMMNDSDISFCEKIITGQLFWCTYKNKMSPILAVFWTGISLEGAKTPFIFRKMGLFKKNCYLLYFVVTYRPHQFWNPTFLKAGPAFEHISILNLKKTLLRYMFRYTAFGRPPACPLGPFNRKSTYSQNINHCETMGHMLWTPSCAATF